MALLKPAIAALGLAGLAVAVPCQLATAQAPSAPVASDTIETRVDAIMATMSLDQKIAQVVQPDTGSFTPADMAEYRVGSYLSGGNSAPGMNERATPAQWLALADSYWDAAMAPRADGRPPVPPVWAIDALHGHNNVIGATLFPHNIGLGAARDPNLVREIGAATAREIAATGIDWTFAPTLAVARDARWGRTYESYSERPELVASLAGAMVEGLQGQPGTPGFLGPDKVIATAKHFLGDGGTAGKDQGDTIASDAELRNVHAAGYPPAISAGVATVMASFSSVNGVKMHGNAPYLTGYLRDGLGFRGLVVGDWNGHGQVPGCTVGSCAKSLNAGLDIFMAPDSWKSLLAATRAQVESGEISMARLDEAVRRILRVKVMAGVFEKGRPSSRPLAGKFDMLGHPEHRALARRAVRESIVLLKNNNALLPLKPGQTVLVAGTTADSIMAQSGGWTISWQGGGDLTNADFPNAQSIYRGIADAVAAAGGTPILSPDGSSTAKPDVAIVVFGERPYAEFIGDIDTLAFDDDRASYRLMQRLRARGVPVVAVMLSGRPLWVNAEINAADAFVAAFLPGSEGGGIADVLFRTPAGDIAHDFRGKLSFAWPNGPALPTIGADKADARTLFPYGYGLSYRDNGKVPVLPERAPPGTARDTALELLGRTGLPAAWSMRLAEAGLPAETAGGNVARSTTGVLSVRGFDRARQEDARLMTWQGGKTARLELGAARPVNLSDAGKAMVIDWRVLEKPSQRVRIGVVTGSGTSTIDALVDVTSLIGDPQDQWRTVSIPLRCLGAPAALAKVETPFVVETGGSLSLAVSGITIAPPKGTILTCGQPGKQ